MNSTEVELTEEFRSWEGAVNSSHFFCFDFVYSSPLDFCGVNPTKINKLKMLHWGQARWLCELGQFHCKIRGSRIADLYTDLSFNWGFSVEATFMFRPKLFKSWRTVFCLYAALKLIVYNSPFFWGTGLGSKHNWTVRKLQTTVRKLQTFSHYLNFSALVDVAKGQFSTVHMHC